MAIFLMRSHTFVVSTTSLVLTKKSEVNLNDKHVFPWVAEPFSKLGAQAHVKKLLIILV